jgi:diguanylate cyclase (GGDEF)-like protein
MNQAFANDILNALTAQIAVFDADGRIVAVNDEWKRFARDNGGDNDCYLGRSYLGACENAFRLGGDPLAAKVLQGIHELMQGQRESLSIEYPCHSPAEQRWFVSRFTRFIHEDRTYLIALHENITMQKQADNKRLEMEKTLRNVLEGLPVGVWVMDPSGKIVHGNSEGRRIWAGARYVGPEHFGDYKGWWLDTGQPIAADDWAAARAINKGETSIGEEIRIECFDGSSKIILNSAIPLRDDDGRVNGAIIVNQDITSRKQVEDELLRANASIDAVNRELQHALEREQLMARTDELTGLHNRRQFFELSNQLFAVARRYQTPLSILMFDLDHFKQVNDIYGHQVGDRVLACVARIARDHLRGADVLARYGGEEFIAALPRATAADAFLAAEHLRENVAACRDIDGDENLRVTISVGVAGMLPGDDTLDRVIQRADEALYEAKDAGRNCSRLFTGTR